MRAKVSGARCRTVPEGSTASSSLDLENSGTPWRCSPRQRSPAAGKPRPSDRCGPAGGFCSSQNPWTDYWTEATGGAKGEEGEKRREEEEEWSRCSDQGEEKLLSSDCGGS
ncbi:uncharacterized protein V6R79_012153 [Siganus canaliculatus]